jgi:single-stranded DNA-binding protein
MKLNRHQIAGRIVEDPEYGSIPGSGIPTIKLRVVTDDGWYDTKKSEYQKNNQYHTVKQVSKLVDKMELRKDDWVFVEGSQRTDSWEGRDGEKKYANFIRAVVIVEIPDPWEKKDTGGNRDSGSGRDSQQRDSRDDRERGGRDGGRDDRRDSRQGERSSSRDRDDDRERDRDRKSDQRGSRDSSGRGRGPDDDIPF